LASFFMEVSKVGYSKTRREVKGLVEAIAQEIGVLRGEKPWTLRQRMNISSPLRKPKRT